jgi:hypothetical protein
MRKSKVVTTFTKFPTVIKSSFCRNVIIKMTDNVNFSAPDVPLSEALDALNALDAAIFAAKDGGHSAISIRRDCVKVVDTKFKLLAKYVDRIADGDQTIILSSGFAECKQPSIPTREVLTITDGIFSGSMRLKCLPIFNAGAYMWLCRLLGTNEWVTYASTQSSFVISDLTVGAVYEVKVAAITPEGVQPYSQVVTKLVV